MSDQSTAHGELRRGSVGLFGCVGQAVAAISPTGSVAVLGALLVPLALTGTWLSSALMMVIVLCTAWIIVRLSRNVATTGGLYGITSRCGGRFGGVLTAFALVFIGLAAIPAQIVIFANYVVSFLHLLGTGEGKGLLAAMVVAGTVLTVLFTVRDIRISVSLMLVLEIISVASIIALLLVVLGHGHGSIFDSSQLSLKGVSVKGIALAMVIGIFAFEGFESATVFGQEAKNPRRVIPQSVVLSVVLSGLFFIFASYSLVYGYHGNINGLTSAANPLSDLAHTNGVTWLSYVVDIGIIVSTFAVIVATVNLVARAVFTLAREHLIPAPFAKTSSRTKSPVVAVSALLLEGFVLAIWVVLSSNNPVGFTGPFFTLAGFFAIAEYFIVSVGGPVFLARSRDLKPFDIITAVISAGGMAYVLYESLVPIPGYPDNIIAWMFIAVMLLAAGTYLALRRYPEVLDRIGRSVIEDTDAANLGETAAGGPAPAEAAGTTTD
ncbi:MAG: APC family permease [Streptosporangiaceae bacterium]